MSKETINVDFSEYMRDNFSDSVNDVNGTRSTSMKSSMKGKLQVYERHIGDNKKLYLVSESPNLIVYRGRQWLLQRALNQDVVDDVTLAEGAQTTLRSWKGKYLSWFSIGTGGAVSGSPLTATSPALTDTNLDTPASIGAGSNYKTVYKDTANQDFHKFDTGYPRFCWDSEISDTGVGGSSVKDPVTGGLHPADAFLVGCIQVTLDYTEGNGTGYQDINEVGLYVSSSNLIAYSHPNNDMELFARSTFSTIRKTDDRQLIFIWKLYF